MIKFQNYGVEHIYCINYIKNNRKPIIQKEFDFIGINYNDSNIFSWEYDYDDNVYDLRQKYEIERDKNKYYQNKFEYYPYDLRFETFKLSLRNYSIMKKSLDLGYNKIMVFEDDIVFLKDINYIKHILDNQDFNCDILLLGPSARFSRLFNDDIHDVYAENVYNFYDYYVTNRNTHYFDLYCAGCNIYSRDAMKAYIYIIENICCMSPDLYFYYEQYHEKNIKIHSTIYPICCQRSDIGETQNFKTVNINEYRF